MHYAANSMYVPIIFMYIIVGMGYAIKLCDCATVKHRNYVCCQAGEMPHCMHEINVFIVLLLSH